MSARRNQCAVGKRRRSSDRSSVSRSTTWAEAGRTAASNRGDSSLVKSGVGTEISGEDIGTHNLEDMT